MTETSRGAAWSDDPIRSATDDRFRRLPFVQLVAGALGRVPLGANSTVFGLVGPWGSGKSSAAALVSALLPDDWIVQQFTPWAASGVAGLQAEFVSALDSALGGTHQKGTAAREAFKKYSAWVTPFLEAVPFAGKAVRATTERAIEQMASRKPWATEFEEMATQLKVLGSRVLIICDDIDRLDATELLEFLKVVRLLGRFPNIHYLIAYDADTVEDLLAAQGIASRRASFMEKIVQHPFELPAVDYATRFEHAAAALNRTLAEQDAYLVDAQTARASELLDALADGLQTPRQISRFEQHLSRLANMVVGEVDLLDFAGVAYLRLLHHEVYEALPTWAPELRQGITDTPPATSEERGRNEADWLERISEVSRRASSAGAWPVIRFLFPMLRNRGQVTLHDQAFADAQYTERYYSLGIPANDVSDTLISRAVASLATAVSTQEAAVMLADLIDRSEPAIAQLAVRKAQQYRAREPLDVSGSSLRIAKFLNDRLRKRESESLSPSSPKAPLFSWFAAELFQAYAAREVDRAAILGMLGEEGTLAVVLEIYYRFSSREAANVAALMRDFAAPFRVALSGETFNALMPLGHLRQKLTLISRADGMASLFGFLDDKVRDDPAAFEALAVQWVETQHFYGGNGESRPALAFDLELWNQVISGSVREQMIPTLPDVGPIETLDRGDATDENRRRVAIATMRHDARNEPADPSPST